MLKATYTFNVKHPNHVTTSRIEEILYHNDHVSVICQFSIVGQEATLEVIPYFEECHPADWKQLLVYMTEQFIKLDVF